jgi:hypothetical protein
MLKFDEHGNPKRGLRTFGEIAHFVRCIPYKNHDVYQSESLWCSPDFVINIKAGTEEDHALLMASCFRTVKHEDQTEFDQFVKEQKSKLVSRGDKDKALLKLDAKTPAEETKTGGVQFQDEGQLTDAPENRHSTPK